MRSEVDRRQVIAGAGAAALLPISARAQSPSSPAHPSPQFVAAWDALTRGREAQEARVTLEVPRLAENGNSVPIKIAVDSPMTAADHVRVIHLLSEQNPIAVIARFHIGPRSGAARVATIMRLATTQNVRAVAEMSDGSLWQARAESVVLLAACLDAG